MKNHIKKWESFQSLLENQGSGPLLWAVTFGEDERSNPSLKGWSKILAIFGDHKRAFQYATGMVPESFLRSMQGMPRSKAAQIYIEEEMDGQMIWPISTIEDLFKLGTHLDIQGALGVNGGVYDMEDLIEILSGPNPVKREEIERALRSRAVRSRMF